MVCWYGAITIQEQITALVLFLGAAEQITSLAFKSAVQGHLLYYYGNWLTGSIPSKLCDRTGTPGCAA